MWGAGGQSPRRPGYDAAIKSSFTLDGTQSLAAETSRSSNWEKQPVQLGLRTSFIHLPQSQLPHTPTSLLCEGSRRHVPLVSFSWKRGDKLKQGGRKERKEGRPGLIPPEQELNDLFH